MAALCRDPGGHVFPRHGGLRDPDLQPPGGSVSATLRLRLLLGGFRHALSGAAGPPALDETAAPRAQRRTAGVIARPSSCRLLWHRTLLRRRLPSAKCLFQPPRHRQRHIFAPWRGGYLNGDGQALTRLAATHNRGRPTGDVVSHGVTEADEILIQDRRAERQRRVDIDRTQN